MPGSHTQTTTTATAADCLRVFHPVVADWFSEAFAAPTPAQSMAWPAIADGQHTLLLAPTGSGKTLAAFLVAINRIMFPPAVDADAPRGVSVLYISPLKALGVDVERNLRTPLAGVRSVAARAEISHHLPRVAVRSGDTSQKERRNISREPPDILITTPESLYLMLTSRSRSVLSSVHTVIVDEIHSLVASKRGAHLFLSLERLERLVRHGRDARRDESPGIQRIGLSATQRPLDEVARLLGGADIAADGAATPRPVQIIEAGRSRELALTIEVPVEDMASLAEPAARTSRTAPEHATDLSAPATTPPAAAGATAAAPTATGPTLPSIWPAVHPRLVELVRSHRSTMIFVNSRRLAERLAGAINEVADEEIALAHHGSIARDTRLLIEDRLKRGDLPAIVATSSLELGIDMGAVDLVIQIEAPPSVASGLQRIGRAGHQVDATSTGVVFPKYRGDLLACSAAAERMRHGKVEETFYPRNPLDVLAQQIVAIVAEGSVGVDELFQLVRCAAPFSDLPRPSYESVLDLLAGRYPSDEFASLRPRINWDRLQGTLSPRKGTQRTAVLNAGTIPDRGLYGVFLAAGEGEKSSRVGELDEEMVFEMLPNDVFLLGASSWRVVDIDQDRVHVIPAPGEPGRMPFWRGDGPGRPMEFGQAIGALARELVRLPADKARRRLVEQHGLDERAAGNLLTYLNEQQQATGEVPSDRTIVVECFLDEVGDWRAAILSPFGARVHAPWATAVRNRLQATCVGEVDVIWSDDGIVFRLSEADGPPEEDVLFPGADEIEELVVRELHSTSLFAARFRENAARALLLPRRSPGRRTPLWLQRRRSSDLLKVASRYQSFPIMLETFRECLRDVFDLQGLRSVLAGVESRAIRVRTVRSESASPFAASLLFSYTGNFIYDGDAPLAERRAAVLSLDYSQLRELLGDAALRELLNADVVDELALQVQRLEPDRAARDRDEVHDLLRQLGDLTHEEIAARCAADPPTLSAWLTELKDARRILEVRLAGELRCIAAEDAGRFRDALGINIPHGLPDAFLEQVTAPLADLVSRYARTHAPFHPEEVATRLGIGTGSVRSALQQLAAADRVTEGEFLPRGRGREWCDTNVLRTLKRRSLAHLRRQVEPVEPAALTRFLIDWHGISQPRQGLDAVLDAVEQLQGLPLPVSVLERQILPARIEHYRPGDLDELCAAGEILWQGCGGLGAHDGRIALYLTDSFAELGQPAVAASVSSDTTPPAPPDAAAETIRSLLQQQGGLFFDAIHAVVGGFRPDLLETLWSLVWAGEVTNDTLRPLRSLLRPQHKSRRRGRPVERRFRSRRTEQIPGSEGRWSLLQPASTPPVSQTERQTALALQLIRRHGILTRQCVTRETLPGGFTGIYPVCKALEEAGRVRRGYFVAGLGASQFAAPGADERLRDHRDPSDNDRDEPAIHMLSAVDPASPFGSVLEWPTFPDNAMQPQRAAGATVILADGALLAWLNASHEALTTFPSTAEQQQDQNTTTLAAALRQLAAMRPLLLKRIDGKPSAASPVAERLVALGFSATSKGLLYRPTGGQYAGG